MRPGLGAISIDSGCYKREAVDAVSTAHRIIPNPTVVYRCACVPLCTAHGAAAHPSKAEGERRTLADPVRLVSVSL